ncbi:MAG: hypothetical protein ACD_57C00045G0002 [uncultured bacterium]|uniref:4-hydroxy-tetrahydrodipicolinate synthase n=1 Tax=Candidatus Curtissbacteria bacterium RIFOXYA1_FULL_41_14 TaxID=1797737 RepID=A0A1F5HB43_9BACT|nr:MAG: hypothetical protein ACD_57C00045G0002 [uncultured bacterium]KKR57541.1 MAG: Dihydrodipicolinate synthase [Candidatus Curtissbacteria bacterium GW2011_GWB1_40_28]KKR74658.1 MAG: Dihydrodipicolinate synthase [Candidatus Curtissbacteria bacterium GW2011_GWD1_40_8]KKS02073.1 MAG: Dihydrodipicolinate synthase [Candidatus Curtissbacteria bacterium GW2011_GWC2_41_21]OGD93429.1 MAG: 4-hydroxy-tetrahydrodipicolinate synthase [Candidatus Curtissbacteria bacterium RIFCSPHIGHO2_12_FULL_41_13]OGE0
MKEAEQFGRLITAMVSSFDEDGQVSVERTRLLAEHLADTGSESIVVSGTTGESPTLTERERMILLKTVLHTVGDRVKVIAGTSEPDTAESVHLSKLAQTEGAHGLLLVTPHYNKPSQRGLIRHFSLIVEAVTTPCILYNVPSRTAVNMSPDTVLKLAGDFENIVGLKEAVGVSTEQGRSQVALLFEGIPSGFKIWSGNDQDTLQILRMGGHGVVSVASHLVGDLITRMINHHVVGEGDQAQQLHDHLMPLFEALFPPTSPEPSPSAIKAMLNLRGIPVGTLRPPVLDILDEYPNYRDRLQVLLANYNLLPQGGDVR